MFQSSSLCCFVVSEYFQKSLLERQKKKKKKSSKPYSTNKKLNIEISYTLIVELFFKEFFVDV